jgi:hypothetical protein
MKISRRRLGLFGAIAIVAIILITLLAAPANNKLNSGSSYNRAPEGYGAWYAFIQQRGIPIQRWRKPFADLATNQKGKPPITLLRVHNSLTYPHISDTERNWIEQGNTLVNLGVRGTVTAAPFSTIQRKEGERIKIDTQRREKEEPEGLLGDRFGAIVWSEKIGKGQVIYATTPHLAANAYQDFPGNYEFLAKLVSQNSQTVWIDEYIHGYKDAEVIKQEHRQNVFSYLAQTPLFPAFVQGCIILLVTILALNRRFGKPLTLSPPVINNSQAYIQALASVLQKANSSELILELVGKEEKLQLQKALVLGEVPLENQELVSAWAQQTGRPATELQQLLQIKSRKHRISETDLLTWLGKWENIRRHLPYSSRIQKDEQ